MTFKHMESLQNDKIAEVILFGNLMAHNGAGKFQYHGEYVTGNERYLPSFVVQGLKETNSQHNTELKIFSNSGAFYGSPDLVFRFKRGVWHAFLIIFGNYKRNEYKQHVHVPQLSTCCIQITQSYIYLDSIEIMQLIFAFLNEHPWDFPKACMHFILEHDY